jgi:hypothetical protein
MFVAALCGAVWVFVALQNNVILLILDWKSTLNLGFFFTSRPVSNNIII